VLGVPLMARKKPLAGKLFNTTMRHLLGAPWLLFRAILRACGIR
jgi:hypothetical protein